MGCTVNVSRAGVRTAASIVYTPFENLPFEPWVPFLYSDNYETLTPALSLPRVLASHTISPERGNSYSNAHRVFFWHQNRTGNGLDFAVTIENTGTSVLTMSADYAFCSSGSIGGYLAHCRITDAYPNKVPPFTVNPGAANRTVIDKVNHVLNNALGGMQMLITFPKQPLPLSYTLRVVCVATGGHPATVSSLPDPPAAEKGQIHPRGSWPWSGVFILPLQPAGMLPLYDTGGIGSTVAQCFAALYSSVEPQSDGNTTMYAHDNSGAFGANVLVWEGRGNQCVKHPYTAHYGIMGADPGGASGALRLNSGDTIDTPKLTGLTTAPGQWSADMMFLNQFTVDAYPPLKSYDEHVNWAMAGGSSSPVVLRGY